MGQKKVKNFVFFCKSYLRNSLLNIWKTFVFQINEQEGD